MLFDLIYLRLPLPFYLSPVRGQLFSSCFFSLLIRITDATLEILPPPQPTTEYTIVLVDFPSWLFLPVDRWLSAMAIVIVILTEMSYPLSYFPETKKDFFLC